MEAPGARTTRVRRLPSMMERGLGGSWRSASGDGSEKSSVKSTSATPGSSFEGGSGRRGSGAAVGVSVGGNQTMVGVSVGKRYQLEGESAPAGSHPDRLAGGPSSKRQPGIRQEEVKSGEESLAAM